MQGEIEQQRHKPVSHPKRAKVGTAAQPYRLVFSIGQLHAEGEVGWWYVVEAHRVLEAVKLRFVTFVCDPCPSISVNRRGDSEECFGIVFVLQ